MEKLDTSVQEKFAARAAKIIWDGGVVAGPTDTVYGLFCDARNTRALKKVFAMKGRTKEKALPVFVRDIKMARFYAYISDAKAKFLDKVWPGPLTVIFHHKEKLPKVLTGGKDTIALRIPDHPFLRELMGLIDFPLAQTSANIFGKSPARNTEEIMAYFSGSKIKPDLIIDAGKIDGRPSSIIDCTGDAPVIIRTGMLSFDTLNRFWDAVEERG